MEEPVDVVYPDEKVELPEDFKFRTMPNKDVSDDVVKAAFSSWSLPTSEEGFKNASSIYSNGGYSLDTSDPIRSYQGFSLQAKEKMFDDCPGCPYKDYSYFWDYYGSHT